MDSKQFSSSCELEDREFEDKSLDRKKDTKSIFNDLKNKDYFDNLIIEDEEENDEEKRT